MDSYNSLLTKLESFIRRYYLNELIKGAILFVSIGLLYFILTLLIEYFLWLNPFWRQVLFWSFILVEVLLLGKFIVIPLLRLFKLSKGLDHSGASKIIGNHFPEVRDKLLNLLQLKREGRQSELLLAGIDQKAKELQPVPFSSAVDFRVNLKYLKYAVVPVLVILAVFLSGNSNLFADSYTRVVNYKTAYEPPAPFSFQIMNPSLDVRENESFVLQVRTIGDLVPENAYLEIEGQRYFLNSASSGNFEYTFEGVKEPIDFSLTANGVNSREYTLDVVRVPRLLDFEMLLDFPNYTGRKNETLNGSGNASIPEGTRVEWRLKTVSTERVDLVLQDTVQEFAKEQNSFTFEKGVYNDLDYQISTSNGEVKAYETLDYNLEVIKDQYPELDLEGKKDSLDMQTWYFYGRVSDDYGVRNVQLVYYPEANSDSASIKDIPISGGNIDEFVTAFPDTLSLVKGTNYEFFFRVFDNDGLRNGKSVKSKIFHFRKQTDEEIEEERLRQQNNAIEGLDGSLEKMELSKKELEELSQLQREKGELNYNDRRKLESFLKRQQQQNKLMKNYTEKLKESLSEESRSEEDKSKEQLKERLQKKEERLEENEELLKELEEYSNKISQEELSEKLEELSKRNQNQEKSLEQLLELTKRYYVSEKTAKVARDLEKLSGEQEKLSEAGEENNSQKQDSLNQQFEKIEKELGDLEKENSGLKEPMDLGVEEELQKEVKEEQKEASEELENGNKEGAKKKQKNASEGMKKMASKMKQQKQMSAKAQMQEDVSMLRQILDNLLIFSFEQEDLREEFQEMERNSPQFASRLRRQNLLKNHFQHVDDSLYSLALRNPMISEQVTEKLTDIEFDLDKALERLAQNELSQGIGSQQYVITGANDLAYFLNNVLENMQDMMSSAGGEGSGGEEMQLPDLIHKQGELSEEMKEGIEKKEKGENSGGEEESGKLFKIFQEQQKLRRALEEKLEENGLGKAGEGISEEMEQLEEELLEKGFSREVMEKMQNLEHKLLDLEDAKLREGQKEERESNTNEDEFENTSNNQILKAKEYFNTTEILNRQILPLRRIYQQKVREYFERADD